MQKIISKGLSGNAIKIIGLISMTLDHIGYYLVFDALWLRIIGRLAFPLFGYMIAEGAFYTKDRNKYFIRLVSLAIIFQLVTYVMTKSLYQGIFVTYSLSVILIYIMDNAQNTQKALSWLYLGFAFAGVYIITNILPRILVNTDFKVDYGLWGVMLPVMIYAGKTKKSKLMMIMI